MKVLTMGTFDVIHFGHFRFLKRCREIAGKDGMVVLGLNTDDFVLKYKKEPVTMPYEQREKNLMELPWVDYIFKNNQPGGSAKQFIERIMPDIIAVSTDWSPWGPKKKDYLKQLGITQEFLDKNLIILAFIPHTPGVSSTEIKASARGLHN